LFQDGVARVELGMDNMLKKIQFNAFPTQGCDYYATMGTDLRISGSLEIEENMILAFLKSICYEQV